MRDPHYPASALALTLTKSEDPDAVYIDWPENDPENPFNWPKSRRWLLVSVCFLFTACTAFNGCGYPSASFNAAQDLRTTQLVYLAGNTAFLFAVSITPLVLAPLSEVYGRNPIYLSAVLLFTLLYIPQALAKNITTIIVVRWFQGMAASVGNSMVAGSVSDVFHASERGFPMSLYAIAVYIAQGVSPYISSVTVNRASWRIMFWWQGLARATDAVLAVRARRAQLCTVDRIPVGHHLHLARSDSDRVCRLRMERRAAAYGAPHHCGGRNDRLLGQLPPGKALCRHRTQVRWKAASGGQAVLCRGWCSLGAHRAVHLRLDGPCRDFARRSHHWADHLQPGAVPGVLGGVFVPCGCVRAICEQCSCSAEFPAQYLCRLLPAVFAADVREAHAQVRLDAAGGDCVRAGRGAVRADQVRRPYPQPQPRRTRAPEEEQEAAEWRQAEQGKQARREARRLARAARQAQVGSAEVDEEKILDTTDGEESGAVTPDAKVDASQDCDNCNNPNFRPPTSIL
ncbi:hypothetical protein L1887_63361 [Cichorium endivia]|nr:hypothetical protein L1887_63361 [Cichorium endivia]